MRITKFFIFLAALACLAFCACNDQGYYESTSVTRTGAFESAEQAKPSEQAAKLSAEQPKSDDSYIRIIDYNYGSNGFIFMLEIPANTTGVKDKFKGVWDTQTCYAVGVVEYASGESYCMPNMRIYRQARYEEAKAAFNAGKAGF